MTTINTLGDNKFPIRFHRFDRLNGNYTQPEFRNLSSRLSHKFQSYNNLRTNALIKVLTKLLQNM